MNGIIFAAVSGRVTHWHRGVVGLIPFMASVKSFSGKKGFLKLVTYYEGNSAHLKVVYWQFESVIRDKFFFFSDMATTIVTDSLLLVSISGKK